MQGNINRDLSPARTVFRGKLPRKMRRAYTPTTAPRKSSRRDHGILTRRG